MADTTFQSSPISLPISSHLVTVKFNHENFLLWNAQVIPYLMPKFVYLSRWNYLCPQLFVKNTNKVNSAYTSWQQQDQAIMSVLISNVSLPIMKSSKIDLLPLVVNLRKYHRLPYNRHPSTFTATVLSYGDFLYYISFVKMIIANLPSYLY